MSRSADEIEGLATELRRGADPEEVRERLGEPLVVSPVAGGGETWLYVRADPDEGRYESLSAAFDADGFLELQRKPID